MPGTRNIKLRAKFGLGPDRANIWKLEVSILRKATVTRGEAWILMNKSGGETSDLVVPDSAKAETFEMKDWIHGVWVDGTGPYYKVKLKLIDPGFFGTFSSIHKVYIN